MNIQIDNLQENIDGLTADESIRDKVGGAVTTIGDATGIPLESAGAGKLLKYTVSKLKSKFGKGGKGGEADEGDYEFKPYTETDLEPTTTEIPSTELGSETVTTTEPSGSGLGDVEMSTFADHNAEINESDPNADQDIQEQGDQQIREIRDGDANGGNGPDAPADDGEAGDAGEAGEEIVGEGAEEITGEVTAETVGAALDATGIGAIIGVALQVGAGIFGAVEAADSNTDESAIDDDEQQEAEISKVKAQTAASIAKQQFTGANVMPNFSSTLSSNVTAGAF